MPSHGSMKAVESVPGVCRVEMVSAPGTPPNAAPDLLIEVPHGATRLVHFRDTRERLIGDLDDDLEQFFLVNTDVGSIEVARWVARLVTRPEELDQGGASHSQPPGETGAFSRVCLVRGVVARTFIDCNRVIGGEPSGELRDGMTPGLPAYVCHPEDVRTLRRMHGDYQSVAAAAYAGVCGAGGGALILHTYAPRSVRVERVDEGIVAALRRAYRPGTWESWPLRPEVDLIAHTEEGRLLAPAELLPRLAEAYRKIGVEVGESATYSLHRETMGYVHSAAYPGQVTCLEIRRDLLADPYEPFTEMRVGEARARRMAAPIAQALVTSRKTRPTV